LTNRRTDEQTDRELGQHKLSALHRPNSQNYVMPRSADTASPIRPGRRKYTSHARSFSVTSVIGCLNSNACSMSTLWRGGIWTARGSSIRRFHTGKRGFASSRNCSETSGLWFCPDFVDTYEAFEAPGGVN
jgi:hypothetical protein